MSSKIVFTPLPVICADTVSRNMPGDRAEDGSIQVYTAQAGEIFREESPIEINLRGNTSKWLPKQSYRVKFVDKKGNKENMSLCGLRSDDDWILNPMYSDTSKIREALAYRLWDQINSVGDFAKSSRIAYAEVFLRGQYWGLYGVQERIDRKQVDASKHTGVLYKVFSNDRPTAEQLLACTETERCGGFEIKHRGEYVAQVWQPAAVYMSFLDGNNDVTGAGLSLRNVIVDGNHVDLTAKEFDLLLYLAEHAGVTVTRGMLLRDVWGYATAEDPSRTVDSHIKTMRIKLGDAAKMIQTMRGTGYRLSEEA